MRGAILVLLFLPGVLWGQSDNTTVTGRVLDPSGHAVVHAEVTLRNTLSGVGQTAQTTDVGEYSFGDLTTGEYIITASANGLAAQTRAVHISAGKLELVADIALPLASVQQDVTVVSGSRVEELQQDSPLPVDVVTKQRIERTGFESVADVLSELPGVVTRNNASFSGSSQEQIDGVASQDVLVLQDGLPIVGARGINSGIIDLDQQNIGRLDRVEVVRGAASSLYQGFVRTEYVSNRLGLIANIRGNFFGRWLIDPTSGQHEKAYAIWNPYASKDIRYGLQAYAAIDNLGNSRDSLLSQTPPSYDRTDYGRTFRIGMRYTLPHE